jgi:hypothetical protein
LAARRRSKGLSPRIEGLEDRVVLSAVTWVGPNGGDWDTAANWSPAGVPNSSDAVVITPSSAETILHGVNQSDSVLSLTTNSNATLELTKGSLNIGASSSTFGGPVTVGQGAALSVGAGASVIIGGGQSLVDNGTVNLRSNDTLGLARAYNAATQVVVNGTLNASGDSFAYNGGNPGYASAFMVVNSGGHLVASNSSFGLDYLSLAGDSVFKAGDLTGDTFNLPIYVPYTDVQYLANNASFEAIEIEPASLPSGQTLALNAIGTATKANLYYNFYQGFTVAAGATLDVGANVYVLLSGGQSLVDSGTMNLLPNDTLGLARAYNAATQVVVNGTLNASGDSFAYNGGNPGYASAFMVVNSGGILNASHTTFACDSLNLNPGSSGQLAANSIDTQLAIDSGSIFSQAGKVTGNDFSSASATVLATGGSGTTIYLTKNYWGTMPIAPKIKSDGLTVVYTPTQPNASPSGVAAVAVAVSPPPVMFSTASQTVTLSASVTSGATKVDGGSVMFTVLNGINNIGKPVTATVVSGTASASYTLPGSTAAGTYTIQAIYLGTASYLGSVDAAHTLTVNTAATTTTPAAAQTFYSTTAQSVTLSATVTSSAGTVNEGTVTFTVLNGATTIASSNPAKVGNGKASASVTLPPGTAIGPYTIHAVYSDTGNFSGSNNNSTLRVTSSATTTTVTSAANPSVFGQTVIFTAVVTPVSPGAGTPTGTVTFKDGTTVLGSAVTLVGGAATLATSGLALGSNNSITAVYSGDSHFNTSTSTPAVIQTVKQDGTTTQVNGAPNPSVVGQTVVLTVVVIPASPGTGTPTGTVTFEYGTTTLGMATLSGGEATFSYSSLPVGTDVITAVYSGDADFTGSSGTTSQIVESSSGGGSLASPVNSPTPGITALSTDAIGGSSIQDLALEQVSTRHSARRLRNDQQKVEHKEPIRIKGAAVSRPDSRYHSPEGPVLASRKAVLIREAVSVESGSHRASRR